MSDSNNTIKELYNQLLKVEQPIQALRHYLEVTPDEYGHHSLINVLTDNLEMEFKKLQSLSMQSASK